MSGASADEVVVNGRKRLNVQIGIFACSGILVFIAGFIAAYIILYLDRHNDSRYLQLEIYNLQMADAKKLHDEEMSKWDLKFTQFTVMQDEMRGDIKQLLQIPRQVDNLERRIRYAKAVDHPKELPGGVIAEPQ